MKRILLPIGMVFAVLSCTAATEELFDAKQALTQAGREYINSIFGEDNCWRKVTDLVTDTFMRDVTPASHIKLRDVIVTRTVVYTLNKEDGGYSHTVKLGMAAKNAPIIATLLTFFFVTDESIGLDTDWFNDVCQILVQKSSYSFETVTAALQIGINNIESARPRTSPVTVTDSSALASPAEYIAQLQKAVQAMIECAWYIRMIAKDSEVVALRKKRAETLSAARSAQVLGRDDYKDRQQRALRRVSLVLKRFSKLPS